MFKAQRYIQSRGKKKNVIVEDVNGIINNDDRKIEIITEYFKNCFYSENEANFPNIKPSKLDPPFEKNEIIKAVKSLKCNRATGIDELNAELIKYGSDQSHKHITDLLNDICEKGDYPEEIKTGILTPLPKPGKPKGPVQNLRPVILLSVLRKILAICTVNRLENKLRPLIPVTQCAYTAGRSATELAFSFKLLCEKAINSTNFSIHLLMLDISYEQSF